MSKPKLRPFGKPGSYGLFKDGQSAVGLDYHRMIRDVLNECGYPCIKCGEKNCVEDCNGAALINPNVRTLIDSLEATIAALEARIVALGG